MRTQRTEVHEAGKGNDPELSGVNHVTTIELQEEPASDTWVDEHNIKRRTNQKPIG